MFALNLEIDSPPTLHWQEVISQGNQGVDLNSHWNRLRLIFESLLCYFDVCLIEQLQTPRTKVIRRPRTGWLVLTNNIDPDCSNL